jgi:hypothetical protein
MGFVNRKKSGKTFNGSKLNVTGQGISTTKLSPPDKIVFNDNKPSNSTTTNSNQN